MDIRAYLKENTLLFDGAMGTYYAGGSGEGPCELANLTDPAGVEAVHRAYIEAGARAVKTNTFAAAPGLLPERWEAVVTAGYELAVKAAGEGAFVFADIGPAGARSAAEAAESYRRVADMFLSLGARHFLFETMGTDDGLGEAAAHIRERAPGAFILVSFAAQPDGFTRAGESALALLRRAATDRNIDAVGLNCVSGAHHMAELARRIGDAGGKYLSFMPNAGYPTVRGGRTFYDGDPAYFAAETRRLRELGGAVLGGCCGTTPEHIAAVRAVLDAPAAVPPRYARPAPMRRTAEAPAENAFWDALCDPAKRPFAVELDSPANADVTKFMDGAAQLRDAGAAIITIADCPIARARMDSSLMACKLRRELGVDALPHMTCRDRNLNATQALLLGLSAEGVRNVLIVTGDPIPSASRDEVKSVYNFHSRQLIKYVAALGEELLETPFRIFGALNVNARNFHIQLGLAREKEANGACGFLTQPVLTPQALENLKLARATLRGRILGGIIPVVSRANALFMNSEISGITVDERVIAAYEGADRARGEQLAEEISAAAAAAMAPYVDGYYLMTPFGRTALMARIMRRIRDDGLA